MKTLFTLIILLATGCSSIYSAPLKPGDDYSNVRAVYEVNYMSAFWECDQAFTQAIGFFRSHGIALKVSPDAQKMFTCLPCPPSIVRMLSPVNEEGLQRGNIAYARMCGGSTHQAKVVIHELAHLFGATHKGGGIMHSTGAWGSGEFNEQTLGELIK